MRNNKMIYLVYALLIIGGLIMVFPFLWMLSTSLRTGVAVFEPTIIPREPTLVNYKTILGDVEFFIWMKNSVIVATVTVISVLFFDSLVGYTLEKIEFRGKKFIFIAILATLMVPVEMVIIPWFLMSLRFGLHNTYGALLFPGLVSAFGVFLMRQFFAGVPNDILDAGRIDGLSEFGVFWHAALPMVRPALAALGIFTFLGNWNSFLWPIIAVRDRSMFTLPVGLSLFSAEVVDQWDLIMTGASVAAIPMLVVFFFFQKKIIEGVQLTGIK